jgi:hypothetical protein
LKSRPKIAVSTSFFSPCWPDWIFLGQILYVAQLRWPGPRDRPAVRIEANATPPISSQEFPGHSHGGTLDFTVLVFICAAALALASLGLGLSRHASAEVSAKKIGGGIDPDDWCYFLTTRHI